MHAMTSGAGPRVSGAGVLRWVARLTSLGTVGIILAFAFGEGGAPRPLEWLMLAFFPIGLVVGLLLGWWRELLGGAVAVGSLAMFYVVMIVLGKSVPTTPYFAILGAPGALFLVAGLWRRLGAK